MKLHVDRVNGLACRLLVPVNPANAALADVAVFLQRIGIRPHIIQHIGDLPHVIIHSGSIQARKSRKRISQGLQAPYAPTYGEYLAALAEIGIGIGIGFAVGFDIDPPFRFPVSRLGHYTH